MRTSTAVAAKPSTRSSLGFHMGEALCRVASAYPTVLDIILEQIQNAIDANAKNIRVVLNRKTRHIAIRDNGDGTTQEMFEEALQRVCLSGKEAGKLGRFGIGLISPLGKCEHFTFTSCHKGVNFGYREWTFVTDKIRKQQQDVTVPHRERKDLLFIENKGLRGPKNLTTVLWRTEVNIFGYSPDKLISRIGSIEALKDTILERFGPAMRKHKVTIDLKFTNTNGSEENIPDIQAKQFTGRPLREIVISNPDAGKVTFKLFLATKTTKGQHGKVLVGESDNDYRFGFELFARSAEKLVSDEVVSGLKSGVFEGEILAEKVKLHSTRTSFEKDDAWVGLCVAIEEWYQGHGAKHIEEVNEARRDQRYQDLGQASLRELETMLQDPAFADIRAVFKEFKLGTVGSGIGVETKLAGKQAENALSVDNAGTLEAEESGTGAGHKSPSRPDPEPYTVAGPRGKQRALVKRGNLGLQFSYIAMDGSDRLWELDDRQGVLHFNVNHPTWVACDGSDRKILQLQETVAISALMTKAMPNEYQEVVRLAFDETLRPLVYLFHASPAFDTRKKVQSAA